MPTNSNLFFIPIYAISAAVVISGTVAVAQEMNTQTEENTWVGVVSADNALVRCGANESYYPIAAPKNGSFVLISGKRQNWFKLNTSGDVFGQTVGYIKYPTEGSSVLVVNKNNGTITEDVDVLAKNIESDELYRSWRPILRLTDGETVQITNTETTDPGTLHRESFVVQTIKLPSNGVCWIDRSYIERATPEQTALFYGTEIKEKNKPTTLTKNSGVETVEEKHSNNNDVTESDDQVIATETAELKPLSLAELEVIWGKIAAEPVMKAEVDTLCDMYSELLESKRGDLVVEQVAGGRIKQLNVWVGLQKQRKKIAELREELALQAGEVSEYQSVMSLNGKYTVVGVLAVSNTFDGRLRPLMYRIQDQKSGRTLGYLPANKDYEFSEFVGQTVGIAGKSAWNSTWRVPVIENERFDLLSPTTAIVTPDIQ